MHRDHRTGYSRRFVWMAPARWGCRIAVNGLEHRRRSHRQRLRLGNRLEVERRPLCCEERGVYGAIIPLNLQRGQPPVCCPPRFPPAAGLRRSSGATPLCHSRSPYTTILDRLPVYCYTIHNRGHNFEHSRVHSIAHEVAAPQHGRCRGGHPLPLAGLALVLSPPCTFRKGRHVGLGSQR